MPSKKSYTLGEIAHYVDLPVIGDKNSVINGLNTIQKATSTELSFLANSSYQQYLKSTTAGALILSPDNQNKFSGNKLVASSPYYIYALITELFAPENCSDAGVHPSVVIGEESYIGNEASVNANVVIGSNVTIGKGVTIGAGCVIGDNVIIGEGTILYPNVSIYHDVAVGQFSIIHSQAVIGADGFGFAPKTKGEGWQKIYQLGGVIIGDYVEVGAGTTIDRGALGDTLIANGVKLDNQIQIAHNVEIGENTAIAGATAIAGSTIIGQRCTIAGAVGIIGHLTIQDDVHITAMTLVTKSIKEPGSYSSGTPMNKTSEWRKNAARFNRLGHITKAVNKLTHKND